MGFATNLIQLIYNTLENFSGNPCTRFCIRKGMMMIR